MDNTIDNAIAEWRRLLAGEQRCVLDELRRIIRIARERQDSGVSQAAVAWEAALALLEAAL